MKGNRWVGEVFSRVLYHPSPVTPHQDGKPRDEVEENNSESTKTMKTLGIISTKPEKATEIDRGTRTLCQLTHRYSVSGSFPHPQGSDTLPGEVRRGPYRPSH